MHEPIDFNTHTEISPKRVRVVFADQTIADSSNTRLVWEHNNYPEYYFPVADVQTELLISSDQVSKHESLGDAKHFTLRVGNESATRAAWQYTRSPVEEIRDLIRFDWAAMDRWYEEDEEVFVHPRNPYARIDVIESRRHIQVKIDGAVVADSVRPRLLFETHMPTRYYLPQDDVRLDLLRSTDTATRCPYKGIAKYWTATINGVEHSNVVWSYQTPLSDASKVAGLVCFYNEKVDITVDGVAHARPVTKFS